MICQQLYFGYKILVRQGRPPFLGGDEGNNMAAVDLLVQVIGLADLWFEIELCMIDEQRQFLTLVNFLRLQGEQLDLFADLLELHIGLFFHGG